MINKFRLATRPEIERELRANGCNVVRFGATTVRFGRNRATQARSIEDYVTGPYGTGYAPVAARLIREAK